jgi:Tol biopolymer transport system component
MRPLSTVILTFGAVALFTACNNPEEIGPWPDGASFWVGSGAYPDTSLAWSPFGDILLFSTYGNVGSPCIFGFSGTGTPAMRTFSSFNEFVGPWGCWNATLGKIVYAAIHEDGSTEIRAIPGNSTSVEVILSDSLTHMYPSWNPSGDSLIFCTEQGGLFNLRISPYGEFDPVILFQPAADCLRPSWSPDGSWILFQYREAGQSDIWLIRPDGSDPHVIITGSSDDIHPCWGPYDEWIAFSSDRTGNYEIWLYDISSDKLVQVTDDPAADIYPAWNPSHEWIAFSSDRYSGVENYDIFSIHEPDEEY